jgi:hypothetical protein
MIAQLAALGQALATLARDRRDESLATLEQAVLQAVRAALPGLLTEVLRMNTRALQAPQAQWAQPCPQCGRRTRGHSWRMRTVHTVCGAITWERPWYVCRRCGHGGRGFSPADASLGLEPRTRLSAGLMAWLLDLGAHTCFREAARLLEELTGLAVSAETIRQRTEQVGTELEAAALAASETVQRTQEPAAPLDLAPGQLVVETDGVMVRYVDGWHEVKLGLVAGLVDHQLRAPSYVAARASPEQFGPRLLAEAARRGALEEIGWVGPVTRRGLAVLPEVVVLGDGAPWIWNLAAEQFGTRTEILDFYHATEHLWTVAHALYPEDAASQATASQATASQATASQATASQATASQATASQWAHARIHELFKHGAGPVRAALRDARAREPAAVAVLQRERGYFRTNAARMAYPAFRQRGLPIGSGAIESSAKHLVQLRLKRPGARWSEAGAQGVLNVRCQLLSGLPLAA